MNDTTHQTDTCTEHTWCEMGWPHQDTDHYGQADMAQVTATANRSVFFLTPGGVAVPEIVVALVAPIQPCSVRPPMFIRLAVSTPENYADVAALTLDEAQLLVAHLTQLLREVGR